MTCTVELEGAGGRDPPRWFCPGGESSRPNMVSVPANSRGLLSGWTSPSHLSWRGSVRETSLSGFSNTKVKNLFSLWIMNNINLSVPLKTHLPNVPFSLLLLHLFMNDPNMWCHMKPSPHLFWYFSPDQTAEPHIHQFTATHCFIFSTSMVPTSLSTGFYCLSCTPVNKTTNNVQLEQQVALIKARRPQQGTRFCNCMPVSCHSRSHH